MKVIQVGLGEFGFSWFKDILSIHKEIEIIGIVDKNISLLNKIKSINETIPMYTDLSEAIKKHKPDFILNITPPAVHQEVNRIAFLHSIPILSEKPIAETYSDALEIYQQSLDCKVPIMIAENYRYSHIMRWIKELLIQIGNIDSIHINFRRSHFMTNYHKDLTHPLLLDVTIHHIDLIRYFVAAECETVFAKSWTPKWTWYKGYSNLNLLLEMENDVKVSYNGSLSSHENETDWFGDWRIEGDLGILKYTKNTIHLSTDEERIIKAEENGDSRLNVLDEFIQALKEKRPGETDIRDNIKTMEIVHSAILSIENSQSICIRKA